MEMLMKSCVLPGQLSFLSCHTQAWPESPETHRLPEGAAVERALDQES